jgi:Cys-tRNA(Pro)/Cys-tRNA(Cys) deacylase
MLPAHIFLDQLNLPYETGEFTSATEKGAANVANRFGFKERQMVKTLIFETDQNECLLVMVGGDQSVISGYLKKAAGSRNIRLASFEAVKTLTGYEIGSIPPFSWQPPGFRSFLEASLMEEPILGVGAGVWGQEIFITPQNLAIASRAQVINLTDRNQPVFIAE